MKRLLVATHNIHKIKEIELFLSDIPIQIMSLVDLGINLKVEETAQSFESNALKKAKEYQKLSGEITLAEDSGLEVCSLGGQPGVMSARYGGEELNDSERVNFLLKEMENIDGWNRAARFVSVVVLLNNNGGLEIVSHGYLNGFISHQKIGSNGFGYDPIFWLSEKSTTTAKLSLIEKNKISHRGKALKAIKPTLKSLYRIV